jgi:hypothetical protein
MIITITFILFTIGLLFFGIIPFVSNHDKKKKEKLCRQLSRQGAENGLIFCSQELLQNIVIGFDGIHRKIMVIERNKKCYNSSIICLDEVQHCQLVTPDGAFDAEDCKNFSKRILTGALELRFQLANAQQTASINFTNGVINSKSELALIKAKAEYWCVMFSKMLKPQIVARA